MAGIIITNGTILDPSRNLQQRGDLIIRDGKIHSIAAPNGSSGTAKPDKVIDATGCYVTPGLIDIHTHVYVKGRASTLYPDDTSLVAGTTTVVDAGVSGWRNFDDFKATIIDKSQTRVLAFLNILGRGMSNDRLDENNVADMDPERNFGAKLL